MTVAIGFAARYTNVHATTPHEGLATADGAGAGVAANAVPSGFPGLTKTTTNARDHAVIGCITVSSGAGSSFTAPTGWTRNNHYGPTTSPNSGVLGLGIETETAVSAAGTIAGSALAPTNSKAMSDWAAHTVALRPAAGTAPAYLSATTNVQDSSGSLALVYSSIAVGQYLEATIVVNDATAIVTPPAGWTQLARVPFVGGVLYTFYRFAADSTTLTFTFAHATPPPAVPGNTAAPVASVVGGGQPITGATLSTTNGTWTNAPTSFAYQWQRDGVDIAGATASTRVLAVADEGHTIRCNVTATNAAGASSPTPSNGISAIAPAPVNTVAPAVTGTAAVGAVLACSTGTWTNTPTSFTYQWNQDGTPISGATASTYTVVTADVAHTLTCTVTATNAAGSTSAGSNGVAIPAAPVNTVAPVITTDGTPATGETVTVSTGTWTGTGIVYTYQWYRGISPLTGETTNSYTLAVTDEGANITCQVTATNGGGSQTAVSNTIVPAVTAPLSSASFLTYYSGGAGNTSPPLSIGGSRGGTYPGGLDALFGPIAGSVALAGGVFYRVIYVRNTHTLTTLAAIQLFIEQQLAHAGLHLAVAVPNEGANVPVAAMPNDTTDPFSGSPSRWTTATTPGGGLSFGSLGPSEYRGIYVRLTVDPATTATSQDDFSIAIEGS